MEDGFFHTDPFQAISKFFSKGWFFKPWDLTKSQSYYQSILEATESVKFNHFFHSETHSEPAYSTATILKVLSPNQWGDQLHKFKSFSQIFKCVYHTVWPIPIGIINKPGLTHSSYKTQRNPIHDYYSLIQK